MIEQIRSSSAQAISPSPGVAQPVRGGRAAAERWKRAPRAAAASRELGIRVVLVFGSLVLVLGILEEGLRLLGQTEYRSTGVVGASPWGEESDVRDRNADLQQLEKRQGVFRVLVVGDSVTWGSGVHAEDAYPARLARRFRGLDSDQDIDVVSWSKTGWNTRQEWRSLEGHLDLLQPDLLILGYSLNDPEPDRIDLEQRMTLERRRPRSTIGFWLFEHSRLFSFVQGRLENTRQRHAANAYYDGLYEETAPARRRQLEALRTWVAEMRRRDVPMVLVIFPMFETQFDGGYPYAELHLRTAELARELELPVLDLLPRYAGVDARRLAVEPFTDSHPNELAHRMAADVLSEWLIEEGFLPLTRPFDPSRAVDSAVAAGAG